jgi:hypothetical protein
MKGFDLLECWSKVPMVLLVCCRAHAGNRLLTGRYSAVQPSVDREV